MSWRDDLTPGGSWRDVAFLYRRASVQGGRRTVVHEYPQAERAEVEDTGLQARVFQLDMYVLGEDYHRQLARLEAALERGGPGVLVHPTRGRLEVFPGAFQTEEMVQEGGMARVSTTFTLARTTPRTPGADTTALAADAALDAREAADAVLVARLPESALAVDAVALQATTTVTAEVATATGSTVLAGLSGAPDALLRSANAIVTRWDALDAYVGRRLAVGGTAQEALARLTGLPNRAAATYASTEARLRLLVDLRTWYQRPRVLDRTLSAPAGAAVTDHARATLATTAATVAAGTTWRSAEEARAGVAAVLDMLSTSAAAAPDALFASLKAAARALVVDLDARAGALARLGTYTPGDTEPLLVVAHRLYGPAGLAFADYDLQRRNPAIVHPGCVPGGLALEVVSV